MIVFRRSLEELWPAELGCLAGLLGPRRCLWSQPWQKKEAKVSLQTIS